MRLPILTAAGLILASQALAQETAQRELNAMTGAPAETRCFQSVMLAQELATHYVASGLCPQNLSAMDPGQFMTALAQLKAIDDDFASDACQVQMRLMFRAGREWIAQDARGNCAATAEAMRDKPFFRDYVRER